MSSRFCQRRHKVYSICHTLGVVSMGLFTYGPKKCTWRISTLRALPGWSLAKHLKVTLIILDKCSEVCVFMVWSSNKRNRLFKRVVKYLGQIVSARGYRPDTSNIQAIRVLKTTRPKTVGEVRKLLGLLEYYSCIVNTSRTLLKSLTHTSSYYSNIEG